VRIDIVAKDAGCELTLMHEGVSHEQVTRAENGWATMLRGLEKRLGADAAT
jgi:hypothetical protein